MNIPKFEELLKSGVHFGHLSRKWNPSMAPYIFMERNGIHIIDLHKSIVKLEEACNAIKNIAKSGRRILFVATKKQAKAVVSEKIKEIGMPYVTERWPGGMLTNFPTIRKAVKKMASIDRMATDESYSNLSKRERLQVQRQRAKLEKNLGSIADLTRLPAALFVVDINKEYIAVREAQKLNIPVFAMVDTNSNPNNIDFPIPSNDDASKSIAAIIDSIASAIIEGIEERKLEKEKEQSPKGASVEAQTDDDVELEDVDIDDDDDIEDKIAEKEIETEEEVEEEATDEDIKKPKKATVLRAKKAKETEKGTVKKNMVNSAARKSPAKKESIKRKK